MLRNLAAAVAIGIAYGILRRTGLAGKTRVMLFVWLGLAVVGAAIWAYAESQIAP